MGGVSGSAHEGAAVDLSQHAIPILGGLNPRRHRTRARSTAAPFNGQSGGHLQFVFGHLLRVGQSKVQHLEHRI